MHSHRVIWQVARLHAEGLEHGFLSSLGHRFLVLLYTAIDESEESVLIVEMDGETVAGFITGGNGMRSIYRRLLRRPLRLTVALAPTLISPKKLLGILDVITKGSAAAPDYAGSNLPHQELLSMAVAPGFRGKGISERLYLRLCGHFAADGAESFRILVGEQLDAANRFYRRMGAVAATTTNLHCGSLSTIYVQKLPVGPARFRHPDPAAEAPPPRRGRAAAQD